MFEFSIIAAGLSLSLFVLAQVSGFAVQQWQWSRVQKRVNQAIVKRQQTMLAELESKALQLCTSRRAWTGWRELEVVETTAESDDCRSFYLVTPDQSPLPPFRPGQFVVIGVRDEASGAIKHRCYSLSDAPDPRYWRITVKRVPGGLVSNHLHDRVAEGSRLLVQAPAGGFVPSTDCDQPLVLVAAGVGITPMMAMIRYCLTWQPTRNLHCYYQAANSQRAPFVKRLEQWAAQQPQLRLRTCFSQPLHEDQSDKAGRLSAQDLLSESELATGEFMLCGPKGFMRDIQAQLIAAGIPGQAIKFEAFQPTVPNAKPLLTGHKGSVPPRNAIITWAESQHQSQWSPAEGTLLNCAQKSGIAIDHSCGVGQCGTCSVRLLRGKVVYPGHIDRASQTVDQVLSCVATPSGDVTIEA